MITSVWTVPTPSHSPDSTGQFVTGTTTPNRVYTKEECEKEIVFYARAFSKRKWYHDNKWIKNNIKMWCNELDNLLK